MSRHTDVYSMVGDSYVIYPRKVCATSLAKISRSGGQVGYREEKLTYFEEGEVGSHDLWR